MRVFTAVKTLNSQKSNVKPLPDSPFHQLGALRHRPAASNPQCGRRESRTAA